MTAPSDFLVWAAARNNAEWCAAMCRSHGIPSVLAPNDWTAPARTPMFYPDAVTLAPAADPVALVAQIDTDAPGASVKDSFADCDLTASGFGVLFEAQWIWRPAGPPAPVADLEWEVVCDADMLQEWASAWDGGNGNAHLFRPELLDDHDTFLIAGLAEGYQVVAGAVASLSDQVVGVSNLFALDSYGDGDPGAAWPVVLAAVTRLFPDMPMVGYEQGEDLAAAVRHGFEPIGPLRVWMQGL